MPAAASQASGPQKPPPAQIGEWFWRFLAVVMLVIVGWVVWIAIQISPPDIILPAAYEAAAQGRASRNSGGAITGMSAVNSSGEAPAPAVAAPPPAPKAADAEPPVNLEKLKRADAIETPIPDRKDRAARRAPDAAQ